MKEFPRQKWEGCRKLFKVLKMRNWSNFNDVYNIQEVFILGVIVEYRWQKTKDETRFDPRCFMSVSTQGAIDWIKSKVILTYPRNVKVVDLMESLLSGGYSSVYTRLGFDTKMFTLKSAEYVKHKHDIIEQLRNLYGEKMKKKKNLKGKGLNQLLYNLFIQEDLNSWNKTIYRLRLDGETEVKKRRVFSKIFKLDENNQHGCAMTKPFSVGIFKQEISVSMEILNKSIENFDPKAKIGEIL